LAGEDAGVITREEALAYHAEGRPGKVEVVPTKPTATQADLSMAYSPGVAEPCREIAKDPQSVFRYTARGNLVAVVTNGTAVLGLGNIGALAGKPVMEGKGVLFKRFADIDVFDIEVDSEDPEDVIRVCQLIAPTFGGINLEDIRAPEWKSPDSGSERPRWSSPGRALRQSPAPGSTGTWACRPRTSCWWTAAASSARGGTRA
jgi:malate dehydrogenase (oxaloacetate-decarboxylating)(NADP+)